MSKRHRFTREQIEYLKVNIEGRSLKDLTAMFNASFNLSLSYSQIKSAARYLKLKSGFNTTFKQGQEHIFYRQIGSEYVGRRGIVYVKIAHPSVYKKKHIHVWETANGPVPKGHIVIFGDGDKNNFELGNLILVTERQLGVLRVRGLISPDIRLTKLGISISDIYLKMLDIKKREKNAKKEGLNL